MSNKSKKTKGVWVMGRNALFEVATHSPQRIQKVYVSSSLQKEKRKESLIAALEKKKIPITYLPKHKLASYVNSESHQSFIAQLHPRNYFSIEEFVHKPQAKLLILDSIFDPQNMGTLIRLAECFAFDGVVFSKNRGSEITPVVAKASCGATEIFPLIKVANLAQNIQKLKEQDFTIIVADADERAKNIKHFTFPEKFALIVGSEGKGVQPLLKKLADYLLYIPMKGKISSLNVSQAAAIFCYLSTFSR